MVDVETGTTDLDMDVAQILRKANKPVFIAVNKVDNYFTLRGYRRRYADLDWDEIINKLIDLLSKIFHIFIYVLVYYPLNFVTSCLVKCIDKAVALTCRFALSYKMAVHCNLL